MFTSEFRGNTMNFKAMIFGIVIAASFLALSSNSAQAQSSGASMPLWVWYVERDAEHLGGSTWISTRGPFATYEQALEVKQQLDQERFQGTVFYSEARIYTGINPIFLSSLEMVKTRLTPWIPYLTTR